MAARRSAGGSWRTPALDQLRSSHTAHRDSYSNSAHRLLHLLSAPHLLRTRRTLDSPPRLIAPRPAPPLNLQPPHPPLAAQMVHLKLAKYGKDKVRVARVVRNPDGTQTFVELIVRTLLEGDIEGAWTHSDNSMCLTTDAQKCVAFLSLPQSLSSTTADSSLPAAGTRSTSSPRPRRTSSSPRRSPSTLRPTSSPAMCVAPSPAPTPVLEHLLTSCARSFCRTTSRAPRSTSSSSSGRASRSRASRTRGRSCATATTSARRPSSSTRPRARTPSRRRARAGSRTSSSSRLTRCADLLIQRVSRRCGGQGRES